MMKQFFHEQVERMARAWSAPSEEFQKELWKAVKHAENSEFDSAVGYLVGEHTGRTLPSVSRFREALGLFRQGGQRGAPIEEKYNCGRCRDQGWISNGGGRHSAGVVEACTCPAARGMRPDELARIQQSIERGFAMFGPRGIPQIGQPLPYDPNEREGA